MKIILSFKYFEIIIMFTSEKDNTIYHINHNSERAFYPKGQQQCILYMYNS